MILISLTPCFTKKEFKEPNQNIQRTQNSCHNHVIIIWTGSDRKRDLLLQDYSVIMIVFIIFQFENVAIPAVIVEIQIRKKCSNHIIPLRQNIFVADLSLKQFWFWGIIWPSIEYHSVNLNVIRQLLNFRTSKLVLIIVILKERLHLKEIYNKIYTVTIPVWLPLTAT